MEFFKSGRVFDFMSQRKFWIPLSLFLTVSSLILSFYPGPNYGTDFKGGTEVEIDFKKAVSVGKLRDTVTKIGFSDPNIVESQDAKHPYRFIIRVQDVSAISDVQKSEIKQSLCYVGINNKPLPEDTCPKASRPTEVKFSPGGDKIALRYEGKPDLDKTKSLLLQVKGIELRQTGKIPNPQVTSERDHKVEIALKSKGDLLLDGLTRELGAEVVGSSDSARVEWVGPKAGKQLRDAAIKSIGIAIIFIMAYVAFRFDLRFAPGGIIALVHDSLVVIGVFVLLKKEVTLSTVAAILTIIGFSIADTVVVYDRIRENLPKYRKKSFSEVINISVSETLSRTILTSGTVLLSMVMFFFWGTGLIRDFSFALVVGIAAGTYSSIFVAAPLTEWMDRKFFANSIQVSAEKRKKLIAKPAPKRLDAQVLVASDILSQPIEILFFQ
jgi:preprotein translocase subunit SecF